MTYQLTTFYCSRCRTGTPHELDEDRQHARCLICFAKNRQQALKLVAAAEDAQQFNDTTRCIAALDGHGNRGEPPTRTPKIMQGSKGDER